MAVTYKLIVALERWEDDEPGPDFEDAWISEIEFLNKEDASRTAQTVLSYLRYI